MSLDLAEPMESHFDDGGARVPASTDDNGNAAFYENLALNHGVNLHTILEIAADMANHWGEGGQGGGAGGTVAGGAMLQKLFRFLMKDCDNLWLGIRLFAWALDHPALDEALGFQCPADFARQCGQSRANATKLLLKIQSEFNLPPRRGQRGASARQNMRDRRLSQLQPR